VDDNEMILTPQPPPAATPATPRQRGPHEILAEIEAWAERLLGGRARAIKNLAAELRRHL
jgi:hypothetical protein